MELQRKIFVTACREKFHAALPLFGINDLYRDHAGKAIIMLGMKKAVFMPGMKIDFAHARSGLLKAEGNLDRN